MTRVPDEPASWRTPPEPDPDTVARNLREQLASAKARMAEHRAQMVAAGLAKPDSSEQPEA